MENRRKRIRRGLAAAGLAAALVVGAAGPAGAAKSKPTDEAKAACEKAGGSWRERGGGFGCRLNFFYGCGVDILVDQNGDVTGVDGWCFDRHGSIGTMTPV